MARFAAGAKCLPRSGSERVAIGKRSATDGYALVKPISLGEAADRELVLCHCFVVAIFFWRRSYHGIACDPCGAGVTFFGDPGAALRLPLATSLPPLRGSGAVRVYWGEATWGALRDSKLLR